jgi:branched-chain amino acid transport system substrate-binding protein
MMGSAGIQAGRKADRVSPTGQLPRVVAPAWDAAGVGMHGIARASIPAPRQIKDGIERIRRMLAANGGRSAYIAFGPAPHMGYEGGILTIPAQRGRELRFDGYLRPGCLSNQQV